MLSKDYILGFVEGEGCFSIGIGRYIDRKPRKNPGKRNNIKKPHIFQVKPMFVITNVESSKPLFDEICSLLGVGRIYLAKRNSKNPAEQNAIQYRVQALNECLIIRDFFKELSFKTQKGEDFKLWSECLKIIESGRHLEKEGILEICRLRDKMNFRNTKSKWNIREIESLLNEKPLHQTAHFDQNQQQLLHNNSFNVSEWLAPKPGNNKQSRFVVQTTD
ncbi:MAG: LAGLIDADG family homing endonuclease [Candidatus Diapherotrites archaeon]|nr:LAGLIDADG family homing endonuclease [Candidatus Diapherotrites archaeon]